MILVYGTSFERDFLNVIRKGNIYDNVSSEYGAVKWLYSLAILIKLQCLTFLLLWMPVITFSVIYLQNMTYLDVYLFVFMKNYASFFSEILCNTLISPIMISAIMNI